MTGEGAPHADAMSAAVRQRLFVYQDGVVLAATLRAFAALGLLDRDAAGRSIAERCPLLPESGFAHLRVGMRTLAQLGWIEPAARLTPDRAHLAWTPAGIAALAHRERYLALGDYLAAFDSALPWQPDWTRPQAERFAAQADRGEIARCTPLDAMRLEGALLVPVLLRLDAAGGLNESGPELPSGPLGDLQGRAMHSAGLISDDRRWTPLGDALRRKVAHLGLAASYLPLLARLPALFRGERVTIDPDAAGREWHVQRELNVRASSAAHQRYFSDADAILTAIFDLPLDRQPDLVLDTGCGDGAWLQRVAQLLPGTRRGANLDRHPLRLVGADSAAAAIERARVRLAEVGVDALVVRGDVGDPDALAATLAKHGLAMDHAVHLHGFIDHDRSMGPATIDAGNDLTVDGAFIGPDSTVLDPLSVQADLTAHLARWAPYAARHGLIALEAHCVPPQVAARHLGALHSVAFDAYHGYSRQYPIDHAAYGDAVRRAGLRQGAGGRCYPASRPFVAVSLNHLRPDAPWPRIDPARVAAFPDGDALHRLLYADGDVAHPRAWCAAPTRALISKAVAILGARAEGGRTLRVCDYGTGTGLAAIELLKACREHGLDGPIELICVDLDSEWFATGRALLEGLPGVRLLALNDAETRFRPLDEIFGTGTIDVILASMVFHLIRPSGLFRLAAQAAKVLRDDGALLWNAPDLAPADDGARLFHEANRRMRLHWEGLLRGSIEPRTAIEREALAAAPRDAAGLPVVQAERARRRVLMPPNDTTELAETLGASLHGTITRTMHEMTADELVAVMRIPSNHREFLPEIPSDALRLALVDALLAEEIVPAMCRGAAGTGRGVAIQWSAGDYHPIR